MAKSGCIVERNQSLIIEMSDMLPRLIQLLRILNYGPNLCDMMKYNIISHPPPFAVEVLETFTRPTGSSPQGEWVYLAQLDQAVRVHEGNKRKSKAQAAAVGVGKKSSTSTGGTGQAADAPTVVPDLQSQATDVDVSADNSQSSVHVSGLDLSLLTIDGPAILPTDSTTPSSPTRTGAGAGLVHGIHTTVTPDASSTRSLNSLLFSSLLPNLLSSHTTTTTTGADGGDMTTGHASHTGPGSGAGASIYGNTSANTANTNATGGDEADDEMVMGQLLRAFSPITIDNTTTNNTTNTTTAAVAVQMIDANSHFNMFYLATSLGIANMSRSNIEGKINVSPRSAKNKLRVHAMLLAPHQVELLFVLCTLLSGRRKIAVQDKMATLDLGGILTTMYPRMSWQSPPYTGPNPLEHIHGPGKCYRCICTVYIIYTYLHMIILIFYTSISSYIFTHLYIHLLYYYILYIHMHTYMN